MVPLEGTDLSPPCASQTRGHRLSHGAAASAAVSFPDRTRTHVLGTRRDPALTGGEGEHLSPLPEPGCARRSGVTHPVWQPPYKSRTWSRRLRLFHVNSFTCVGERGQGPDSRASTVGPHRKEARWAWRLPAALGSPARILRTAGGPRRAVLCSGPGAHPGLSPPSVLSSPSSGSLPQLQADRPWPGSRSRLQLHRLWVLVPTLFPREPCYF